MKRGQKVQTSSYRINEACGQTHSMVTAAASTAVGRHREGAKRADLKSSRHKEETLREGCELDFLW